MSPGERSAAVKRWARELGFDRVGVAPAEPSPRAALVTDWLARGYAGEMSYLSQNADRRTDPRSLLPSCCSVIVVAVNYHQELPSKPPAAAPAGRVARYAWGEDYHRVIGDRLTALARRLSEVGDEPVESRVCVDTAPLVERELAAAAGLGWIGKNTLLLHTRAGSYLLLGEILTSLELAPDTPLPDRCGTCTRCLEACPTAAFAGPYVLDARRCISYLTIEHRAAIPAELRDALGDWLFGCDVCQEVCPYNRRAPMQVWPELAANAGRTTLNAREVLTWSSAEYARQLRGSALKRAKRWMLQRNAAVVLGNKADASALPALERLAVGDDTLLAEHAQRAAREIRRRTGG